LTGPISLDRLLGEGYGPVLCYPRYEEGEARRRVEELRGLGVEALVFAGEKRVLKVPVLGKGCVGIVLEARTAEGRAALKVRRVDADRAGMRREADMLGLANSVGVGPRLLGVTENFLLMEFVEGRLLPRWLGEVQGRGSRARVRRVLGALVEQCRRLDEAGLDHGELSHAPKHVIVDAGDRPWIVDFETASVARRASNVTSICQYLFLGGQIGGTMRRKGGKIDREEVIQALRDYKRGRTSESFRRVLEVCRLAGPHMRGPVV